MPRLAAGAIVFGCTAAVLILEILAGRILAPYVGETLETYTGIIGVVLAGIAAGTWMGGRLADQLDPRRLLGPAVLLGGVLALLVLPLVTFFGVALRGGGPVAIVVLSAVGFFAPAAALSAVTPTVIKIQLRDLAETGETVGRLSALSTAGAIFGTFLTGFVLVANFPSRQIVLGVGVALLAGGAGLWWWLGPRAAGRPAVVVLIAALAAGLTAATPVPCDYESGYYCAEVRPDPDNPTGRLLVLDSLSHSYVDLDDLTHLEFAYMRLFGDVLAVIAPEGEPITALHIGGAAMSLPRYIDETRPGSHSTVVEIDPQMIELAAEEFGYEPRERIDVITADARLTLQQLAESGADYDIVVGDAFGGMAVPWHLTTLEVAEQIRATLADDGVYTLNLIDFGDMEFARAKTATLASVFDHVAVMAPPERLAGNEGGNVVLAASDAPIDVAGLRERIAARDDDAEVVTGAQARAFAGDAQVLTDDFAPVDQLINPYAG